MYTHFIHLPYQEDGDYADIDNNLTWNVVWWDTQFNQGDVVTIQYANPIQTGVDKFSFTMQATDVDLTNKDVANVNVYPNPYYGFHELEASRTNKFVSFNHLPQTATIKIYSLGGTLVRQLDKEDETQFIEWNLKNQYGYPVASGLYIVRIESGGNEKVLKLALVQETQVLKYY